ncbi:histone acetyltransferase [Salinilacihabitans rarus]|uniref:histone acetyltransferase n=1 Tax=Salinilacihabitans rarus TaxID=2961596 RepID=UPI0020C873EF|nr:histone acetyltransferase [Salinilacihabitans rarus]
MTRPVTIPVADCQPSQLLLSAEKLRGVLAWFDADDPEYDPVSVVPADELPIDDLGVDAPYVSIDGHTRAFVATCCGADALRATVETDVDAAAVYARCVDWCLDAGVTDPMAFAGRVVSHETYLEEWVGRCRALECYPSE